MSETGPYLNIQNSGSLQADRLGYAAKYVATGLYSGSAVYFTGSNFGQCDAFIKLDRGSVGTNGATAVEFTNGAILTNLQLDASFTDGDLVEIAIKHIPATNAVPLIALKRINWK